MGHYAAPSKVQLRSIRSPSRLSQSAVRLGPQTFAKARAVRPLKRCAVTRCEQMNGSAPEASVTCLGEALFGESRLSSTLVYFNRSPSSVLETDVQKHCFTDCLAEERGVPKEQVKTWIPYPGGAPANVAAALGRLGVKVSFVSAVGQDDLGEQMLDLLHSASFTCITVLIDLCCTVS